MGLFVNDLVITAKSTEAVCIAENVKRVLSGLHRLHAWMWDAERVNPMWTHTLEHTRHAHSGAHTKCLEFFGRRRDAVTTAHTFPQY